MSVVVPARDEADALPHLLERIGPQLRPGDELIVVDDGSTDRTATVAEEAGAQVLRIDAPAAGWSGKPHACWTGARAGGAELLVFLDADVRPGGDFLDRLAADVPADGLVSVQPWHVPGSWPEQLGLFGNVVALTACGEFSVLGPRPGGRLAFGPVIALRRDVYERTGGHGHPSVRSTSLEDVALARSVGRTELHTGRGSVTYRMYPGGGRAMWNGWTRTLAAGSAAAPPWATFATACWIWALAAAPFLGPIAYLLAVSQVAVVGRMAGRFSPILAACYPIPLVAFVVATVRSVAVAGLRRTVDWRGRSVPVR